MQVESLEPTPVDDPMQISPADETQADPHAINEDDKDDHMPLKCSPAVNEEGAGQGT